MKIPLLIAATIGIALSALAWAADTPSSRPAAKDLRQTPLVLGEASSKASPFVSREQKPRKPWPHEARSSDTPDTLELAPLAAIPAADATTTTRPTAAPTRAAEAIR